MTKLADQFEQALLALDRVRAEELLRRSENGGNPHELVEKIIVPTLEHIGVGWERGDIALSQVYMSGRLCEKLVESILPTQEPRRKRHPRMAITVLDDFHMLGKRIVYSTLRSSGFELLDYGRATVHELVARSTQDRIEVLLISTLMLPSALRVRLVKAKLRQQGNRLKIVVGGAPFRFDRELWQEVGADIGCRTAAEAPAAVNRILEGTL